MSDSESFVNFAEVAGFLGLSIREARNVLAFGRPVYMFGDAGPRFSLKKGLNGDELFINLVALDILDHYATKKTLSANKRRAALARTTREE